ncbi:hypothetical protein OIU84_000150 [Salix udensis]|uniref:DNA-directed RNA polymerase n=1 Tax=Salix udensis TaxID=889485 RepID=A0AAD6PLP4_9ROSI|nr:hypothetical protein OIU84_000150 [Salix udensis]
MSLCCLVLGGLVYQSTLSWHMSLSNFMLLSISSTCPLLFMILFLFSSYSESDNLLNMYKRAEFSRWGNERVYNGRTGEMYTLLTRQPVADRKRFGGIKFGEMERDCLIAHGASANLHERLFTLSDSSEMHICQKCKNVANVIQRAVPGGRKIRGPYCRVCESVDDLIKVSVPYGAKLLCQELFSMGISLKFDTKVS